jgi:hypothetical protein
MLAGISSFTMLFSGCGGSSGTSTPPPPTMTLTLAASSVDVQQDGNLIPTVVVTIANAPGAVSVSVTGLPNGISAHYDSPSSTITISGGPNVPAGSYTAAVTASSGTQSATQNLTVVNDVVAVVNPTVDTTLGVNGKLEQFMSTSLQIGSWTTDFFGTGTQASQRETTLTQLGAQHIRVQVIDGGAPMVGNTGTASDWNFTLIDTTLQPVLASADHSPELQIGTAPTWMCNSSGQLDMANHLSDFAAYMAKMVRYYNKGGFDYGGQHFQSASSTPVVWWGVFNEFNGNGLSASDYVRLYNAVVPAMLAVDPTIKLSAFELSDYGLGTGDGGDPMQYFPQFVSGVTTPVSIVSTHFYSTCNQKDSDTQLFSTVPGFAANVQYFYQAMQSNPTLASTPVWVTENNVNADFDNGKGMSTCNPGQTFVTDKRGTSAFFAAWRPYVFSQLGKAGNQALYQWDYTADQQYGEVDGSGNLFLSYWVDKTLGSVYPWTQSSAGPDILSADVSETSTVEVLATKAANGSVTVMVANHAVKSSGDNNGSGAARTVVVETSTGFSSATLLTIDATTSTTSGPAVAAVPVTGRQAIVFKGYGVAFLTLVP